MRRGTVPVPLRAAVRSGLSGTAAVAERVAFWVAVAFPAVYVGAYALETVSSVPDLLLVSAFLINALVLVVGHAYARDDTNDRERDHGHDHARDHGHEDGYGHERDHVQRDTSGGVRP